MKKDIFKGKIKKEYFSYILGYMIFFVLLFVAGGALCIYAFVLEGSANVSGNRLLLAVFGIVSFVLGGGYVFPQLFLIRNFPKYPKLRRIFFNSDIYFTDSISNEYYGGSRTLRERRYKAAFDIVTAVAEAEKGMGNKKPVRYIVYCVLSILMSLLGLADLIAVPLLFENGKLFPGMSDDVFVFLLLLVAFIFVALAVFFFTRALKVGTMSSSENNSWTYELYGALIDISVRQNNKKHKYWYEREQRTEIEDMVRAASEHAKFKVIEKNGELYSFKVLDTLSDRVVFTGFFI